MNTSYLHEFLVFCKSMNYSVAARELFCSRSALRQHIADLENELSVPLIEAAPSGHRLTPYGRRFLTEADDLARHVDDVLARMAALRRNLLVVSISNSSLAWVRSIFFAARNRVLADHPGGEVQIRSVAGTMTSLDSLLDGSNDIAVFRVKAGTGITSGAGPLAGVRAFKLTTEKICWFAGIANPIFRLPRIRKADLAGRKLLLTRDISESFRYDLADRQGDGLFGMEVLTGDFTDYQEYYAGSFDDVIGSVPERFLERYGFYDRDDLRVIEIEDLAIRSDFYVAATETFLENPLANELFTEMERLVPTDSCDA